MIAISLIVCWVLGFYIGYQFRGMLNDLRNEGKV
jgi:hypothetical protein